VGLTTPEEVMKVTSAEEQMDYIEKKTEAYFNTFPNEITHTPSGFERRTYIRLNSKVNLRYALVKSKEEALKKRGLTPEQLSVTKNISAGGLLFVADEELPLGSFLELKLELPDGEGQIECLAKVVRIEEIESDRNYDIAVCFLDLTGAERNRLNKYIEMEL
jgi:c-di-GMP-binding flagellar brake protein YcgR